MNHFHNEGIAVLKDKIKGYIKTFYFINKDKKNSMSHKQHANLSPTNNVKDIFYPNY